MGITLPIPSVNTTAFTGKDYYGKTKEERITNEAARDPCAVKRDTAQHSDKKC